MIIPHGLEVASLQKLKLGNCYHHELKLIARAAKGCSCKSYLFHFIGGYASV